ncbi:putative ABC transport system substrate-binding protein [Thiogranum longum]|uniref:Putative ABC transport system substrate-binding protein n=1 Tax=Thiogranum longum TaxID=1537524 RepID=A0A4R1HD59_9GAMM|nr:ABC transporter substrate-binding protein [Thiogranum longum]TCK18543.1 putative ABC transport system substrate-binding protein [Thiogranum longum]
MKYLGLYKRLRADLMAVFIVSIALVLAGCGSPEDTDIKTVGIVLFGDSRQPQVNGFQEELTRLANDEDFSIRYLIRNAGNKRPALKVLVKELADQKVDLLVAAGGLEADTMKEMVDGTKIPVVVLYVNSIIERGLVKSRSDPGWDVTGVDNLNAELSGKRVELMRDLLPGMKKILILYYKSIAPSRIGVEKAKEVAEKSGIFVDARAVSSRDEIKQTMKRLEPGEVDAMLTVPTAPIDNALTEIILPNVYRLKLPLMTHSRPLAEKGALASYGANFYDMGKQAARLAGKVLQGVEAGKIPFETPKIIIYTMNENVRKDMEIDLNDVARSQVNEYISITK